MSVPVYSNLDHCHLVLRHIMHGVADAPGVVTRLPPAREGHPVNAESSVVIDHDGGRVQLLNSSQGRV